MRRIIKGNPTNEFVTFREVNPGATWEDFHHDAHEVFIAARDIILINEQNCYCGYTEIRIDNEWDCHLDHYRKRSLFGALTFDWNNLIASCNDDEYGARYKDLHFRGPEGRRLQNPDYDILLNPVADNVEDFIECNIFGILEPKKNISIQNRRKAQFTIDVFNLNYKALANRRKSLIAQIGHYLDLTREEIRAALSNSDFQSVVFQYC